MRFLLILLSLGSMVGCSYMPAHPKYRAQYAHLSHSAYRSGCEWTDETRSSPYFLVILVNARHLDYSDVNAFFRTLAKHPSDGSTNRDFGHAWIYLQGIVDGNTVSYELGHSGEKGEGEPRYFDGVMNYIDCGSCNPTPGQLSQLEPNPIKYLWHVRSDGFCQKGSGGHRPTYTVKIPLTEQQFCQIIYFVDPRHYDYTHYAITGPQCCSFVTQVAALAGLELSSSITIPIRQECHIGGRRLRLWEDPSYSEITIFSPDALEKSMIEAAAKSLSSESLFFFHQ
jgi:hypothetical protein